MKKIKLEILPTFRVSIHSENRGGFRGEAIKKVIKMDEALLNAILQRKFLPEVGDTIHFTSISPDLELKVTNVTPIMSGENCLGNLVVYGESSIFKTMDENE